MGISIEKMTPVERKKFKEIVEDPVKWARVFVNTFDAVKKEVVPWRARWYQAEMLHDTSIKKVARCGRRTGKVFALCL